MIDPAQILASPNRDDEIRKLIVPKPWKHNSRQIWSATHPPVFKCDKCDETAIHLLTSSCPIPDRIDLDWNLAMKMFRAAEEIDTYKLQKAMDLVWSHRGTEFYEDRDLFWHFAAEEYHYILAALIAMEKKDG